MKKNLLYIVIGVALSLPTLYVGERLYYYKQVIDWADQIRISQALQQAAQQAQKAQAPPTEAPHK